MLATFAYIVFLILLCVVVFFFFSSRRRHTRCREVSWARRCVQETGFVERTKTLFPGFEYVDGELVILHYLKDTNDSKIHKISPKIKKSIEIKICRDVMDLLEKVGYERMMIDFISENGNVTIESITNLKKEFDLKLEEEMKKKNGADGDNDCIEENQLEKTFSATKIMRFEVTTRDEEENDQKKILQKKTQNIYQETAHSS
eukprot:TRINITY_DN19736_c0_g1_i1.p1 TRINITY_DN19736_c0_g1~~TRINITY_DN19736_c0_g1_i1.p1  ORF type:complete len:202 (+),score=64.33 TRINITY_DN19736_c0_g1_i1:67-672(+)